MLFTPRARADEVVLGCDKPHSEATWTGSEVPVFVPGLRRHAAIDALKEATSSISGARARERGRTCVVGVASARKDNASALSLAQASVSGGPVDGVPSLAQVSVSERKTRGASPVQLKRASCARVSSENVTNASAGCGGVSAGVPVARAAFASAVAPTCASAWPWAVRRRLPVVASH